MTITDSENQLVIDMKESHVAVLVMERPDTFSDFVYKFAAQCEGSPGDIVLSEDGKILPISKNAVIVSDYYSLDLNSRQIQGRLYQQLNDLAGDLSIEKSGFTSQGICMMEKLLDMSLFDHVTYDLELDWNNIFKMFKVRIEEDYLTLSEKLISFMRVCKELMGFKLLVLVNLKSYLTGESLHEIYKMANYLDLNILLLEHGESEKVEGEKIYIIDKDKCIIIK